MIEIIALLKVDQTVEDWNPQEEVVGEIHLTSKGKNLSLIHQ